MKPQGVLIVSNDRYIPTAKSSEALASACRRMGIRALVRDASHPRYLGQYIGIIGDLSQSEKASKTTRSTFDHLLDAFQIDTVLSLDLQWLLEPGLFTHNPSIARIASLWFDDIRSWTTVNLATVTDRTEWFADMRNGKVTHYFNGTNQAVEGRAIGLSNAQTSYLAAPREYAGSEYPCEVRDRAAFIGNPGLRFPLPDNLMKAVMAGMELLPLRQLCADTFAGSGVPKKDEWIKSEPSVQTLIAEALQERVKSSSRGAVELLQKAAAQSPRAYDFLRERDELLEAALIVKMVNCCDRPAFVRHLNKKGLVDVFSNSSEWAIYGVEALPAVRVPDLPRAYQRYAVHLNASNALRDATANEKLFEIAACGRVSINPYSADIFTCYDDEEVVMVRSLDELEQQARALLTDPDKALAMGAKARERTLAEHLWEHRLVRAFGE
jgi:hypothetical protein